jgi:hypothetical protein
MDPEQINCGMNLARATVFWKSALVTQNLWFLLKLVRELMTVVTFDWRSPSLLEFTKLSRIVARQNIYKIQIPVF